MKSTIRFVERFDSAIPLQLRFLILLHIFLLLNLLVLLNLFSLGVHQLPLILIVYSDLKGI